MVLGAAAAQQQRLPHSEAAGVGGVADTDQTTVHVLGTNSAKCHTRKEQGLCQHRTEELDLLWGGGRRSGKRMLR